MDHETFIETFEEMGFDVEEEEPPAGADRGIVIAENENGDQLCWSVIDDPEVWGIHIDPDRASIDQTPFEWDDLDFEDDKVVIPHATGTRSKDFGYGRAGFDGSVSIDSQGTTITETERHSP